MHLELSSGLRNIPVQIHAAVKYLQKQNGCCARTKYYTVQTLNEFLARAFMLIAKQSLLLPENNFCSDVE